MRVADKSDFCRLIWAVDAIQSGRQGEVGDLLAYPPQAVTSNVIDGAFVHKWMLETLVNEVLATKRKDSDRILNCHAYEAFRQTYNALYSLENEEDALFLRSNSMLDELPRLAHRQFEWQRGWHTQWNMYRSAYLYCGPACTDYFVEQHGLTPANFVLSGYAAFVAGLAGPGFISPLVMPEIGLAGPDFERALPLIALPMSRARTATLDLRMQSSARTAYRPSLLRRFPCISVIDGKHVLVPLPALVIARVTTGLFYDLVKAGPGDVTREMAERFEVYCRELLAAMLPDFDCRPEQLYQLAGQERATPDILVFQGNECALVIECKSTRMSIGVRFGEDPAADAERALGELSKAVFQIWRHFAHVRRGLIPGHAVQADATGLVMTLDPWLRMTRGRLEAILQRANVRSDQEGNIEPGDRRPVAFCAVDDLEVLLSHSTAASFIATVRAAAIAENASWNLAALHERDFAPNPPVVRPYPFGERLGEILPWWIQVQEL